MLMQVYNWTFLRRGVLMTDWEYFWPRLRPSGIRFSIAQVRAASGQTRRETRNSCRHGAAPTAAPSPCPVLVPSHHTLIHLPLITPHGFPSFLFHLDPPVGVLTFPPLHLPLSPSLSPSLPPSPFVPFPFNLFWVWRRARPPKPKTMCKWFSRRRRGEIS